MGLGEVAVNRIGKSVMTFPNAPSIVGFAAVGGKKEGEGPLGLNFDLLDDTNTFGEKTWEKSESRMQREAGVRALAKAGLPEGGVDMVLAGDLLNQCIGTSFAMRDLDVPLIGLYGACSTMAEGMAVGAAMISGGFASKLLCATSSHFCSAERQYRLPIEYGGQRPPSAQWTATAAGAAVLSEDGEGPFVRAAMAPTAAASLSRFLKDTGMNPKDFDLIATGDLSRVGTDILYELMDNEGFDIRGVHNDCGLMLYTGEQDVDSGGSGCGCSASVLCAGLLPDMVGGRLKRLLFTGTGALLSPTSALQGGEHTRYMPRGVYPRAGGRIEHGIFQSLHNRRGDMHHRPVID